MLILHDSRCAEYAAPGHPEQPARVTGTAENLRRGFPQWKWMTAPQDVPDATLQLAHTQEHLARLEEPADFDADTAYFPRELRSTHVAP